jgi:hypothetical protein
LQLEAFKKNIKERVAKNAIFPAKVPRKIWRKKYFAKE